MATELDNGEEIDLETLQAKIDLSMSFADELVSTWVKKPSQSSSTHDAKAKTDGFLEDHMRRPPRLGVGAPVPDSSNALKTAKLKHYLNGIKEKKRSREDEPLGQDQVLEDEEEGESRATAIRKKVKIDPFANGKVKTKKAKGKSVLPTVVDSTAISPDTAQVRLSTSAIVNPSSLNRTERQKNQEKKNHANDQTREKTRTSSPSLQAQAADSDDLQQRKECISSEISSDRSLAHSEDPPKLPPLLNLNGPPSCQLTAADASVNVSTKKRRKRKRKRRNPDNTAE